MVATVYIGGKNREVVCGSTICDAVRSLGFAPDTFIFIIDGKPVPMDTQIKDGVLIKAIKVASGG